MIYLIRCALPLHPFVIPLDLTLNMQLVFEMWPSEGGEVRVRNAKDDESDEDGDEDEDIEKQIAKEMSGMKRPKKETRFGMSIVALVFTECLCFLDSQQAAKLIHRAVRLLFLRRHTRGNSILVAVVIISCKPPVNPVQLVTRYVAKVVESGVTRTRYVYIHHVYLPKH